MSVSRSSSSRAHEDEGGATATSRPRSYRSPAAGISLAVLSAATLAACGSSSGTAKTASPTSTPTVRPAAAPSATSGATAACAALVKFDAGFVNYPGADSDGPAPTAAQLSAWAAATEPLFATVAAGVPASLSAQVAVLRAGLTVAATGKPIADTDGAAAAENAVNHWGHDRCGFTRLEVVNTGDGFTGVPATLPPGPVSVSFANQAPAAKSAIVFLVTRPKPGTNVTIEAVRTDKVDLGTAADVLAAVQPAGTQSPGYAVVQLTTGHYIVASPLGTPPKFTGTLAETIEVR